MRIVLQSKLWLHFQGSQALQKACQMEPKWNPKFTKNKNQSENKMLGLADKHNTKYQELSFQLATHGVQKIQENVLRELHERELITPKLYIALKEEIS